MPHKALATSLHAIVAGLMLCSQPVEAVETAATAVSDDLYPGAPPAAPTLSASFGGRQLHLSWNAVSGARYYRLLQHPAGASGFVQVDGNLTTTSHDRDTAVQWPNWSAMRYLLEACNALGCAASNEVSVLAAALQAIGFDKTSINGAHDHYSVSLAVSGDGNTLAAGVPGDSSGAIGVGGDQATDPGAASSGAVYVFARRGSAWPQQAYVKASNTSAGDAFGSSLSLSDDGNTLAVGAYREDSPGVGINGNEGGIADNGSNSGAVYVFVRTQGKWSQQAYVKASNTHANAYFGQAVSLNGNGNTLAVGAVGENAGGLNAGAVYVFTRSAASWSQQAYVKASNVRTNDYFGSSVALNRDGNSLSIGTGTDSSIASNAIGVYVFTRSAGVWSQQSYVQGLDSATGDALDASIELTFEDRR